MDAISSRVIATRDELTYIPLQKSRLDPQNGNLAILQDICNHKFLNQLFLNSIIFYII
jgi:hypothetical protein